MSSEIEKIKQKYLGVIEKNSSMLFVFQQMGKAYNEIDKINKKNGHSSEGFDHTNNYYLAEYVKRNVNNIYSNSLTISQIAQGNFRQTMAYLDAIDGVDNKEDYENLYNDY